MAFIPAPNCASVEIIFLQNGETCENQFHVHKGSPYSLTDLQAVRTIVNNWHNTNLSTIQGSVVSLVRIRTRALDSTSAPLEDFPLPTPRPGLQGGAGLPGNVTYCVKGSSGLIGRSQRGRYYHIGLTTLFYGTNPNFISSGASGGVVNALNALITQLAAGGHTLGVVSYQHDHAPRSSGQFTAITSWVAVDLAFDSMRRRLAGRGRP